MPREAATAQNAALTAMYRMIFTGCSPKDIATMDPPIGVKRIGVRKAIPEIPNLFQILTIRRLLGVMLLLSLLKRPFMYLSKKALATVENNITDTIIPTKEQRAVCHQGKSYTLPNSGPAKNFTALDRAIDRYLINNSMAKYTL